jgi:hypothetical protein
MASAMPPRDNLAGPALRDPEVRPSAAEAVISAAFFGMTEVMPFQVCTICETAIDIDAFCNRVGIYSGREERLKLFTTKRLALFIGAGSAAALGALSVAQEIKTPLVTGERLRYAVSWRLVPAGEAELTLGKDDSPANRWKASAKATSIGYVSNIYKVDDEYQSIFRNQNLCSTGIHKTINEGERHRDLTLTFDQRRKLALLREHESNPSAAPLQTQSAIPDCVQDILSAMYYVRIQPLGIGQSFEVPVNDGPRTVRLRVEVQAKEEVKTKAGTFQTIRVEPMVFSGNLFKEKGRMFVWFTDDTNRWPVQMSAQIGIGTITASLVEKGVDHSRGNQE